jgi:hypothetical protein
LENFNQESNPNEMLIGLRYFEQEIIITDPSSTKLPKPAFDWGPTDRNALAKCIINLSQQVKKIFLAEPRLIQLSSQFIF